MKLAELLQASPSPLWHLVKQAGVDDVVMLLDGAEQERRWLRANEDLPPIRTDSAPWQQANIAALQRTVSEHALTIAAIEDTAPMDLVRLGRPGREEQIEQVKEQIRAMGALGIPVLCYNWMAVTSWARTAVAVPLRGGALTTGFRQADAEALPPLAAPGEITAEQLWDALEYFLEAVVPVAEQAGVRMALHPDDPPLASLRGVPRIINSVAAYRRVLDLVPSPSNAITLCQGNFSLMPDAADLPAVIRELGGRGAVAFVHFRDTQGDATDFIETFHDSGKTDLAECMRAYAEVGFDGPMRPDHVPTLYGESNDRPGYATLGRLYALGYIRALQQVAYGRG